jgi:hypothetical protein
MTKMNKIRIITIGLAIISGVLAGIGVNSHILQSKFKPMKKAATAYLRDNSTQRCAEPFSEIVPVVILDDWASLRAIPDMKTCITDPCWIVMKKVGNTWQGFSLGNCCFIDVPEALFQGDAEWWPEASEEDKEAYREKQRFNGR